MPSPIQVNARDGDESETAHRSRRSMWIWAAIAALLVAAIIAVTAQSPSGPAADRGRVTAAPTNIRGASAAGIGAATAP